MDKEKVLKALKELRANSKKRNFKQTVDLIVNVKDMDLKNPENHLDLFTQLHFSKGKQSKICALVGPELQPEAAKVCDKTISQHEFDQYSKDKKLAKKLATEFDFFIAQANIMPSIATAFGKVFGPRKKMPNPKAGCVVPPKSALKPLYDKLQKTVRILVKEKPVFQCVVGNEDLKDEELLDNIMTVYDQMIHHLPGEENNIRNVYIKFTMSKPIKVQ